MMNESSNPEWLKKELDEKRNALARCHKIIEAMIGTYDTAADEATKRDHMLGIQQLDVEYLWGEIRKLQKGLADSEQERDYLQKRIQDFREYTDRLKDKIAEAGMDLNSIAPLVTRDIPGQGAPQNQQYSNQHLPQKKTVERHFHCGLDTPESGLRWDADEMIHLGGWCCDEQGQAPKRVWVAVDQREIPCTLGWKRTDVVKAFAEQLSVVPNCGFNVEIESVPGENFLRVWAEFNSGAKHCLMHRTIVNVGDGKHEVGQLDQNYAAWVQMFDTLSDKDVVAMQSRIREMQNPPLISVLLPTYNTDERWLSEAIESVRAQIYPHWQLCVADDASPAPHVKAILEYYSHIDSRIVHVIREKNGHISAATNSALEMANGSYCALLDHDDVLPKHALYHIADLLVEEPDVDLIYSDEDKIDVEGNRFDPYFKSDWNPELFLSHNCISHLGVYRTSVLRDIGGFQEDLFGSQDWDLALRFIAKAGEAGIRHVAKVLYHWRYLDSSTSNRLSPNLMRSKRECGAFKTI